MNLISKEIRRAEHEYMNIHPPPPSINALVTPLDIPRYKLLCDKVTSLVSKAKNNYYRLKAQGTCETNPTKWYKTIFELAAANDCNSQPPADDAADDAADLAERTPATKLHQNWAECQPH